MGFPGGLERGSCTTRKGLLIMDTLRQKQRGGQGSKLEARKQARVMCGQCRVTKECRAWVLEEEEPAGSWGGMIAGLTPEDRRYIRSQKEEEDAAEESDSEEGDDSAR